ncbi:MAG: tetratricopeptide repeat protein [Richelia sp. SM2_1_7]|nr:tetratricopeptide repeat protein [Richelia sp. SM2_1_7]
MARKRFVFLSAVESFVLKLVHQFKSELIFRRWGYRRSSCVRCYWECFFLLLTIPPVLSQMSSAGRNNLSIEQVSQLVEQGRQHYENGEFEKAIESLQQAAKNFEKQKDWGNLASTLSNLGLSQLELGQSSAAFKSWEEAEKYFARIKNQPGITKSRVYQAQALQSLGLYYRACELLTTTALHKSLQCDALDEKVNTENKDSLITNWDLLADAIKEEKDKSIQIIVWRSLGDVLRVIGDLDNSQKALENGLNVAQSEKQELAIHLSLGNTFRAKGNLERDRRSSPIYDYMPWRYIKREEIEEAKEKLQ